MTSLAKLTRPRLYAAFQRERLFALLDSYRRCPVIWIAGPPGAGKTTLIATWLEARAPPGLWYQVDDGDADPATFFYYLREAAAPIAARRRTPLPLLTSEYLPDLPGFARRWFRELFTRLSRPVTLVLDNYQEVAEDSTFHQVIEVATCEVPEDANLIILSRAEPPARFARLQASERFAIVDWDELRLTLDEARGIATGKDALSDEIIRELYQQSDGWAAGFTLMRERARRTGLVNRVADTQTMETVFNYFASQIFNDASAENRDILIRCAFLPRMTAAQAEAISGNPNAGRLLDYLYRRHLFTDRRAGKGDVAYQYHALFQAFLRAQAKQYYTPLGLAQLMQRAAGVLEGCGQENDAVSLYVEARDWRAATDLILRNAPSLVEQGRGQTVRDWITALPQSGVDSAPWLSYWLGMALTGANLQNARLAYERAYEGFVGCEDKTGQTMATVGVLETYFLELNLNPIAKWMRIVDDLFSEEPTLPTPEVATHAYSVLVGIMTWGMPAHVLLPICVERLEALLCKDLPLNLKLTAASQVVQYYGFGGQVKKMGPIVDAIEPLLSKPGVTPFARASWLMRTHFYHAQIADFEHVRGALNEALTIAKENGLHFLLPQIYGSQCDLALDMGDATAAEEAIIKQERAGLLEGRPLVSRLYQDTKCAQLAMLKGDWEGALRESEAGCVIAQESGIVIAQMILRANLAALLIERGELDPAATCIDGVEGMYPPERFPGLRRWPAFLRVMLAARSGDRESWRESLRALLSDARERGTVALTKQSHLIRHHICHLALSANIEVEYVQSMIRMQHIRPDSPDIPHWPWAVKVFTLGAFRLELEGTPFVSGRKAQRKPLDLLKALIAFGGREVNSEMLAFALWPDAEADAADNALKITLQRLRKLLKNDVAIVLRDGKLSLNDRCVWVDTWSLEQNLDTIEAKLHDGDGAAAIVAQLGQEVLARYPGHFLERDTEQPWMLAMRERLRGRVLRLWLALGRIQEQGSHWDEALAFYQRGVELDNLAEEFYRRLMICHRERGQQAEALNAYRRCREMLSVVLGVKPSAETEAVRRSVVAG